MGLFIGKNESGARVYEGTRIVAAIVFFLVLLAIAIAAEAFDWVADASMIYGFAELVLGVIIGWLGGEAHLLG
jgi:hypothetical protein